MNSNSVCSKCGASATVSEVYHIDRSPVHNLLRNNLAPNENEHINAAKKKIRDIESEIASLDEVMLRMHTALSRLVAKRTALHDYVEAHKDFVSPLSRLPAEILGDIFLHVLPQPSIPLSVDEPPLILDLVCKRWKVVSRSTPALWSRISLLLKDNSQNHDITGISACLDRSGDLPLSISISCLSSYRIPDGGNRALALLASHCEQWQSLYLYSLPLDVIKDVASGVKGRLLSMEELILNTHLIEDATGFDAFSIAPRLRCLGSSSSRYTDIVTNRSLCLPWNDLTTLIIDIRDTVDILGVLLDCQNLIHLTADINDDPDGIGSEHPPVKLSSLRSLSLTLPETMSILPKLILPALMQTYFATMSTTYLKSDLWHISAGFDILLHQSQCNIQKFTLNDENERLEAQDVVEILAILPSLTELNVSNNLKPTLPLDIKNRYKI